MKNYLLHYFRGAAASAFNAGMIALGSFLAQATASAAGVHVPPPSLYIAWVTFYWAAIGAAVLYFTQHPLPVDVPPAPGAPAKPAAIPPAAAALLLLACVLPLLSGCSGLSLPQNSCDSATESLNVGPFFSEHAVFTNVSKTASETSVGDFNGGTSYLGVFNFSQEVHNLHVQASGTAATAAAAPAAASPVPAATAAQPSAPAK